MDDPLPPDPWTTLGVQRSASENEIKSAYRKLALKCHPDKFPDEAVKKVKEEEFHNIKQAYDMVLDPAKLSEYEASCKLAEMRKEAMARAGRGAGLQRSNTDMPSSGFKTRTAAPTFATPTASREEPAPRRSYDDAYDKYYENRASSRKHEDYSSQKRSAPKTEEKTAKVYSERKRTETKKDKDRTEKRDRSSKYDYSSESDEKPYRGRDSRRASEDRYPDKYSDQYRAAREHMMGVVDEDREYRRSKTMDDRDRYPNDASYRNISEKVKDASSYIRPHREEERERPTVTRTSSSNVRYDSKNRPSAHVRRSSARPKDRDRERIVEAPDESPRDRRPPPSMPHMTSSPAALKVAQELPRRSHTYSSSKQETSPPSNPRRTTTTPMAEPVSSRKRDAYHSKVKEEDSGYSSPGTPETSYPQAGYPTRAQPHPVATAAPHPSGKYSVHREYDMGHGSSNPRIVERTPNSGDRRFTESPEPIRRPTEDDIRYLPKVPGGPFSSTSIPTVSPNVTRKVYSYSEAPSARPPIPHATSYASRPSEDRGRKLYGEIPAPETRRPGPERRTSYRPEEVSTGKRYGLDDVRFAASKDYKDGYEAAKREFLRESSRSEVPRYDRPMPGLQRHPTMA